MAGTHQKREAVLILHDIRSEHNVGSLFRTADAAGVAKVYLTGYTPAPTDRFGRPAKTIAKVALGGEQLPWEQCKSGAALLTRLRKAGYFIVAIEQDARAVDYKKAKLPRGKVAFVLGNEVGGISQSLLGRADAIAFIPMRGKKESLNVSVAGGIALFRMLGI